MIGGLTEIEFFAYFYIFTVSAALVLALIGVLALLRVAAVGGRAAAALEEIAARGGSPPDAP
jgi:hypothetical protein